LSFFDEGDEPRTTIGPPPPRRPPSQSPGAHRARLDDRTLLARRAGAIAVVLVVIILVALGVKSYLASRQEQALKNYNAQVTSLMTQQATQVAGPVFKTLNSSPATSGTSEITLQSELFADAGLARQEARQAAGWSVPSQMAGAQRDLLLALDLRYEALNEIQGDLATALGSAGQVTALEDIAGAMGLLYSSDVIYKVRVVPLITEALSTANIPVDDGEVGSEQVISSQFLPDQSWLLTSFVAGKILGNTPSNLGGTPTTGTHGHELLGVLAGNTQLVPTIDGINNITYTKGMVFTLQFKNTGENTEFDVRTQATIDSATVPAITTSGSVSETEPGLPYTSQLSFNKTPPFGTTLRLTATIEPVHGETDKANNQLEFLIDFH
jgi:hypothetical protein